MCTLGGKRGKGTSPVHLGFPDTMKLPRTLSDHSLSESPRTMAALTQSLTFTGQRVVSRAAPTQKRASVTTKAALKHADELLETAVRHIARLGLTGEFTEALRDRAIFSRHRAVP